MILHIGITSYLSASNQVWSQRQEQTLWLLAGGTWLKSREARSRRSTQRSTSAARPSAAQRSTSACSRHGLGLGISMG